MIEELKKTLKAKGHTTLELEQKEELKGGTAAKATVKVPEKKIRQRQRASDDRGILNQDPQG
jgi:hypothetical protein